MLILSTSISLGQTQGELNFEARRDYQSADSTLKSVYRSILKTYSTDTLFIKKLKIAQRLWIKFRDAEVKMKYPDGDSYGSVQPLCVSLYLASLTNDRIKTLQTWLDGIEEGDVCSGSVKVKK